MYVRTVTGVPEDYSIRQLRKDNPSVSFPENIPNSLLAEYGVYPLIVQDAPDYDTALQKVVASDPVEVLMPNGKQYVIEQTVVDLTADELEQLRLSQVPSVVTMRQARLALHAAGLLATVDTAMQSAEAEAQIEWEYSTTVERHSVLVTSMAASLSLTDREVDDLFTAAGQL